MENNKLIAEFMGGKFSHPHWRLPNTGRWTEDKLQYHTSWDWIMPVVNKCMQTGDNTDEWDALGDTLSTINITNVYQGVVEFINFYNQNK